MAVYDGFPSVRLEGDKERALALVPEAKALLYEVQNFKQLAGVGTFSMSRRIGEDAYLYALSAHDQHILSISVNPRSVDTTEDVRFEDQEYTVAPSILSGMIVHGFREEAPPREGVRPHLVLNTYHPTRTSRANFDLPPGGQSSSRLSVAPHESFSELVNQNEPPVYSQYTKLRPSMYSGTMKKVVQVLMGFGRLPPGLLREMKEKRMRQSFLSEIKADGVQIQYDYKHQRTHGITTAADGRLWLVEISITRGVIAMPLPIYPGSGGSRFRERFAPLDGFSPRGDSDIVAVIDELESLPTGESFPRNSAALAARIERGDILRLLEPSDLAEFYHCSAYSSAMGWAFSPLGLEAHNTAYYFGDDGFQRGVWYQVNISIGAIRKDWEPGEPIADGSASLRKNAEGHIYSPPGPSTSHARYVPIKFHEPLLPGLLSHEGVPTIAAAGLPVPKVDTPMFVSFVDGDLKVVKYYRNPKQETFNNVTGEPYPGECLLAGHWTITEASGSRSFPNMMYSNDFDDRKVLQEHTEITDIDSKDLGYDPPKFTDFIQAPDTAYVWRERIFRRTTVVDRRGGEQVVSAVAIPQYSREAYYYATGSRFSLGRSGSTSIGYDIVKDPNVGYAWRCFPRIGPPPFPPNRPDCNTRVCRGDAPCSSGGTGFPKERRVVCLAYEPNSGGPWVVGGGGGAACHEFADSGPWLQVCQIVDGFNQLGMDKTSSNTNWDLEGDEKGSLYLISPGYGGPLSIPVTASQVFNHWMTPSPDPVTQIVQFIYAEHSAIGSDVLVYATNLSSYQGEKRTYGFAPDSIGPDDGYPTFIGVNKP